MRGPAHTLVSIILSM